MQYYTTESFFSPQSLNHNNIVNILGYSWKPDVMIVMEYLEEGSLNYYLKFQGDKLSITHLLIYARDVATVSVVGLCRKPILKVARSRSARARH